MRIKVKALQCLALLVSTPAVAYNLFNPVPATQMRELSTDRPDTTESPYTVDAGHFQIEWEMVSAGTDQQGNTRTDELTASINLKAGLTDVIDAQLILEPHTRVKTKSPDGHSTESGINDTEVRLKMNVWGDDGGDTAFAVMPFVRIPTHDDAFGDNGKMEGGLILPLAFKLPNEWDSAVMLEIDSVRNEDNDGYVAEFIQTITFGHSISGPLDGFFEFVNDSRNESGASAETYFNAGLIYALDANMQIDGGFNLGISDAAQDSRLFLGFSYRY